MKLLCSVALLLSLGAGAAAAQVPREDLNLRAFLLKDMLLSYAKTGEVCYVAFSTRVDPTTRQPVRQSPPASFVALFARCPFIVKSVSEYPAAEEGEPKPNPETGLPDGIYTVEIVQWLNSTTARVRTSMYRTEKWARGNELIAEKGLNGWEISQYVTKWTR